MPEIDLTGTPEGDLVDRVTEADKQWFKAHPNMTEYIRPFVEGELPGVSIGALIRVRQLKPGIRIREPLV